jgi:hypothetical protein
MMAGPPQQQMTSSGPLAALRLALRSEPVTSDTHSSKMGEMRPNLFHYAASELSQDAFLAWLLAWSDQSNRDTDPALHRLGVAFLSAIFTKCGETLELPTTVQVQRQVGAVDVLALVGDTYAIIIEDKTDTAEHSNQLARYFTEVQRRFPGRTVLPIYLKTGEQSVFAAVARAGWRLFLRSDLLALLRTYNARVENDIVRDFREHLQRIDDAVASFRTLGPEQWNRRAWEGFYQALQPILNGEWGYVANPSGGFMGFWWSWNDVLGGSLYLQLEQMWLTAKVEVPDEASRTVMREVWSERVTSAFAQSLKFQRPRRFGRGKFMTVALADYLRLDAGRLDLDATVNVLQQATAGIAKIATAIVARSTAES